jgi:4-amino-4-deoxychorismate lyase
MSGEALIDGRSAARIDVRDRGLHYGDGLFETMAVVDGAVRRLAAHLARLWTGCERLGIAPPDPGLLQAEIAALAAGQQRAVLKLILTRGSGGRGYAPPEPGTPRRMLLREPWPGYAAGRCEDGVAVRLCHTVPGDQPRLAGIKHLNRLEQVLARREWSASAEDAPAEGLMFDGRGDVVGGTMSNVFIVREGRVLTPRLDRCGVAGTVRAALMQAAMRAGVPCQETTIARDALYAAQEIFLTNALIGIWPVRRLEDRVLAVGPVTRHMQTLLDAGANREADRDADGTPIRP